MVDNLVVYYTNFLEENYRYYLAKYKRQERQLVVDFTDQRIIKRVTRLSNEIDDNPFLIFRKQTKSFDELLSEVVDDFCYPSVKEYFDLVLANSKIFESGKGVANIDLITEGEKIAAIINVSHFNGTNERAVDLIHELTHFYDGYNQLRGLKGEEPEFVEVLPIFFEYLMYNASSPTGYDDFVHNRLKEIFSVTGLNGFLLMKDQHYVPEEVNVLYKYILSDSFKYILGFNYALSLINLRNEDKIEVDTQIEKVLKGRKTSLEMADSLDIDFKDLRPIEKVLRKKRYNNGEKR